MGAPRSASPAWRAPGRVNLIGDHTDYAEGFVLPMAIDRECIVEVAPGGDGGVGGGAGGQVRARSRELPGGVTCAADGSDDPRAVEPRWGAFVAGAIQALAARGIEVPPCTLDVTSTVPPGSGLSSSSALAVALVLALTDVAGRTLQGDDAALAARDAEVRATGVPGGLMDQLASVHGVAGAALLIDCRDLRVEAITLPPTVAVLVAHSGLPRTLATSEYAARRAATDTAADRLGVRALRDATIDDVAGDPRARHVVTENERVLAFGDALRAGALDALGPLLAASHASLRDDFAVSTPELDALVDAFVAAGALGARLTGAGFGGCAVALARAVDAPAVIDGTAARYRAATGMTTAPFVVQAVAGAGPTSSRAGPPSSSRTPPR